jgi:iron complex outermembrane receptor protein
LSRRIDGSGANLDPMATSTTTRPIANATAALVFAMACLAGARDTSFVEAAGSPGTRDASAALPTTANGGEAGGSPEISEVDSTERLPVEVHDSLGAPSLRPTARDSAASRRVVVRARRRGPSLAGETVREVSGKDLLAKRGGNLAEALEDLGGVTQLRTGGVSKPVVNGVHSQRLPVVVDGIRLEGQSWGAEHAPETDPFQAERLRVVQGGGGVRYGSGAIGGVVVVDPPTLPRDGRESGELLATAARDGPVLGTAARLSGGIDALEGTGWRIQGAVRKGGDRSSPQVVLPNTALEERSLSASGGWNSGFWGLEAIHSVYWLHQGLLQSAHIGNLSDLRTALEKARPADTSSWGFDVRRPDQVVRHDLSKLLVRGPLVGSTHWELVLSRQQDLRQEWDLHRPINAKLAALDAPQLDYTLRTWGADLSARTELGAGFGLQAGAVAQRRENEYDGRAFIPNFRDDALGTWGILQWARGELVWDLGARQEFRDLEVWRRVAGKVVHRRSSWDGWAASTGFAWHPAPTWTVRASAGSAWRAPDVAELWSDGVHHGTASYEIGDSTLGGERSWTGQVSSESHQETWDLEVSAWATRIEDYIALVPVQPAVLTVRGAYPGYRYRATDAFLRGGDLAVRLRPSSWNEGRARLALQWTEDESGGALPFSTGHKASLGWDLVDETLGRWRDLRAGPEVVFHAEAEAVPGDHAPPPDGVVLLEARAQASL